MGIILSILTFSGWELFGVKVVKFNTHSFNFYLWTFMGIILAITTYIAYRISGKPYTIETEDGNVTKKHSWLERLALVAFNLIYIIVIFIVAYFGIKLLNTIGDFLEKFHFNVN